MLTHAKTTDDTEQLVQAQLVSRIGGRRNHTVCWGFGGSQHRQPRCVKTVSNGPTLAVCESVMAHTIVSSTEHKERLFDKRRELMQAWGGSALGPDFRG